MGQNILTVASLDVYCSTKWVGTIPGTTQFTRVVGAISLARAYTWKKEKKKVDKNVKDSLNFFEGTNASQVITLVSPRTAVLVTPYIAIVGGGL